MITRNLSLRHLVVKKTIQINRNVHSLKEQRRENMWKNSEKVLNYYKTRVIKPKMCMYKISN